MHRLEKCLINKELELTLHLIEMPFNTFANRADPDQAALVNELPDLGLLCLLMGI